MVVGNIYFDCPFGNEVGFRLEYIDSDIAKFTYISGPNCYEADGEGLYGFPLSRIPWFEEVKP